MITDANLLLENSRTDVRAASTYVSGNTIDLSVNRDIGAGEGLKCMWNVEVAYAGGTSIQFQQILSAAANLSSPVVVSPGRVIPLANLVLGAIYVDYIPELLASPAGVTAPATGFNGLGSTGLRYFGTQEVSVGTFTAGQHSARIVKDVTDVKHYPSGYTIL
ncbi:hypothetical protein JessAGP_046c [Caulobacter phage Jess A]|nr:hypothetical protein JessAGP_046c [Caulobacter phage Jess A]QNH91698.1 major capsid protein [Caulobacter phage SR18]WCA46455.1 hypothetical protein [Caulobacter phage RapA]